MGSQALSVHRDILALAWSSASVSALDGTSAPDGTRAPGAMWSSSNGAARTPDRSPVFPALTGIAAAPTGHSSSARPRFARVLTLPSPGGPMSIASPSSIGERITR